MDNVTAIIDSLGALQAQRKARSRLEAACGQRSRPRGTHEEVEATGPRVDGGEHRTL